MTLRVKRNYARQWIAGQNKAARKAAPEHMPAGRAGDVIISGSPIWTCPDCGRTSITCVCPGKSPIAPEPMRDPAYVFPSGCTTAPESQRREEEHTRIISDTKWLTCGQWDDQNRGMTARDGIPVHRACPVVENIASRQIQRALAKTFASMERLTLGGYRP